MFGFAQEWLRECKCAHIWDEPGKRQYPKRLLDIEELRKANGLTEVDALTLFSEQGDLQRTRVRLIDTNEVFDQKTIRNRTTLLMRSKNTNRSKGTTREQENARYVTLSHCWGKPKSVQGQLKLSTSTEERFKKEGIELRELPKTFRDAILFACRLDKVGFVWIDSLCIMQPTANTISHEGASAQDWLEQSRIMDSIYENSYLNISATAAIDGDKGLFFNRRPEYLWEDDINVNYTGTNLVNSSRAGAPKPDQLTRCTIIDLSFWDELVETAPVNRRGWVLQERLMAPRVLHFCRDQIAWECAEFEDAEGHPEMNLTLRAKLGVIVDEGRLKNLTPEAGLALRNNRLQGLSDPDISVPDLYMYEHWKRIVEVYSRMQLTVSRDKLIALSGIAKLFGERLFQLKGNKYIAGLWRNNLESQLLWQVNEVFKDGVFENPARRDLSRAPSFSWASVDTPHGITYPDVTDYGVARSESMPITDDDTEESIPAEELLVQVVNHHISHADSQNAFGMVEEGKLLLQPRYLRQIKLRVLQPPLRVPFSWHLDLDPPPDSRLEHTNLYLDAPESEVSALDNNTQLYCMPVAFGERTVRKASRYLYCLLLKEDGMTTFPMAEGRQDEDETMQDDFRKFRRIGITKLSNHADEKGQTALREEEFEGIICLC